jgi:hypothetical protein
LWLLLWQEATKEDIWHPLKWRRNNLLYTSVGGCGLCIVLLEFSFWSEFGDHIWSVILVLKLLDQLLDLLLEGQLHEGLLKMPVSVLYTITQGVMNLGASTFLDFLYTYLVGFAFLFLTRMYVSPYFGPTVAYARYRMQSMIDRLLSKLPRWLTSSRYHTKAALTKAEEAANAAGGADGKRRVVALFAAKDNETVEPILKYLAGYSVDTVALLFMPVVVLLLIIFRDETGIPALYSIRQQDMTFYLIFMAVVILFQYAADIFIHGAIENFHGWKVYDYLVYTRYRFLQRETRWKGMEDTLDECIDDSLRTLDQMCFSSQYYMMMALYVNGLVFIVLGTEMMIRNAYNLWSDPAFYIIFAYTLVVAYVAEKLILCFADQVRTHTHIYTYI